MGPKFKVAMSNMFKTGKQVWCWPCDVVALVCVGWWVRGMVGAGLSLTHPCALAEAQGGEGEEEGGGACRGVCRGASLQQHC